MSKIYGKIWAEGNPNTVSTRQGHRELTSQVLYGSKSDSRIAAEITVEWTEQHGFILFVDVPALRIAEQIHLPFEN